MPIGPGGIESTKPRSTPTRRAVSIAYGVVSGARRARRAFVVTITREILQVRERAVPLEKTAGVNPWINLTRNPRPVAASVSEWSPGETPPRKLQTVSHPRVDGYLAAGI